MSVPSPAAESLLTTQDREHLRLLVLLHYVSAGLTAFGLLAAVVAFFFVGLGIALSDGPDEPPAAVWILLAVLGTLSVLFSMALLAAQYFAARNLHQRRGRTLVLIVAAIEALNMPLGTLLGVFTILVLSRDSVRAAFDANDAPQPT